MPRVGRLVLVIVILLLIFARLARSETSPAGRPFAAAAAPHSGGPATG